MANIEATLRQLSNENTAKTFAFNSSEAQKSRDYQTQMSNTSHQREVEDLKRAGINPVLSANGGAQAYSASSASGSADNSAVGMLASIYQTKMNNDNARQIAKMQNQNALQIAKINAAASNYASNNAYAASAYASDTSARNVNYQTDRTKTGAIYNFMDGLLNNRSNNAASKVGKQAKGILKYVANATVGFKKRR